MIIAAIGVNIVPAKNAVIPLNALMIVELK